jgi:hypothetical protein
MILFIRQDFGTLHIRHGFKSVFWGSQPFHLSTKHEVEEV